MAEEAIGKEVADYQVHLLMNIRCFITLWSLIAGAGKTFMMIVIAKMVMIRQPDALVWYASNTNNVVNAFVDEVAAFLSPDQVLHLRVGDSPSGVRDFGDAWLASKVAEKLSDEHDILSFVDTVIQSLETFLRDRPDWMNLESEEGQTFREFFAGRTP